DPGLNQGEVFLDQNARRQGAQPRHNRPSQFQQTRLRTGGAIIPSTPECEWTTRLVRYGNGVVTTAPVEVCLDPYTGEWVPQS
ncbi:MAG: hypothetical protein AAFQ67_01245, partial [Pseudomonadota bacterium]